MSTLNRGLLVFCILLFVRPGLAGNGPQLSKERVIFHTNFGDIVVALYPVVAPRHVEQMLKMVAAGVYSGTPIFRLEPGFVAQVANYDIRPNPLTAEERATVNKLPAEFSDIPHRRGLLSMARYDDPNSAESSFSFMLGDAPHLNGQYTVFGEVVRGLDVLDGLAQVPTNAEAAPLVPITISTAETVTAAQLESMALAPLQLSELPSQTGKLVFEIFAALMFAMTVALPIVKTALAKNPAKTSR